jgi:hypothetical protein
MVNKYRVLDVPLIDQTIYDGYVSGAGGYLCSAACLTMVLQYFLESEQVDYDTIANSLIDEGYLDTRGLLSGDYLERFVCQYLDKYPLIAQYSNKSFNLEYLVKQIAKGKLVIANVPNHYTLITGYKVSEAGNLVFHVNDPFREHWQPDAQNAVLSNEWVSARAAEHLGGEAYHIFLRFPAVFICILFLQEGNPQNSPVEYEVHKNE